MNITLTGKKISQDERILAFKKDNLTAQMTFTVDTDDSWTYKLDVRLPVKCCTGEELFNIIDLPMDASRTCTIDVTAAMVPFTGKYTMQLRGISGEQVYHSDTFEIWVKYSIDPGAVYDPVPSEFYQIEQNVTEMNNHPPKPGQNGYWLVWDITTSQYKESDIPLQDGMLPEVTADTSGKYLSNDGKKAYWAEVQTGTESKIDKIEVNGVEQPIVDKTVNIAVPTKTSDLSNDSGYITNEALDGYATKAELPTKVSQLENDSKFINESALDGYAKTDDIPTKTSQLNNDANYITAAQAPVQSVNNKTGAVTLSAADVSAIPSTLTGTAGQVLTKTADGQEWKDVDIPTALPNPNALTFTGAVTGSYDGSAPLSVEIPSGGGGGGSSQWKIIRDLTITENAARVDINTDDAGKAFSLHEIHVLTSTRSYEDTAESFTFLMNGYWLAGDPYFNSGFKSTKSSDNYYAYNHFIAIMQDGIANVFQPWKPYILNMQSGGDMFSIGDKYQAIESVSFVGKFIAGCRFVLVGRVLS